MRVTFQASKAETSLNIEVEKKELEKWDNGLMRFTDRNMPANKNLNKIESKFDEFKYNNATNLSTFTVKMIRDTLMGVDSKPIPSISTYLSRYYDAVIHPNEQLSEGTKRNYRKTKNHVISFLAVRS